MLPWIYCTYSPRDSQIEGSSHGIVVSIWLLNSNLDLGLLKSVAIFISRSWRLNWNSTTLWIFLDELICFRFWFNERGSRRCLRAFLELEIGFWIFEEVEAAILTSEVWTTEWKHLKLRFRVGYIGTLLRLTAHYYWYNTNVQRNPFNDVSSLKISSTL